MQRSGEHGAFVVEEFIAYSESVINTQLSFRRHFVFRRHDSVPDKKTINRRVSNFRETSSPLKKKNPSRPKTATGTEKVA